MAIYDGNNNPVNTSLPPDVLRGLLQTGLTKPVKMVPQRAPEEPKKEAAKSALNDTLPKVIADFGGMVKEAQDLVRAIFDYYKQPKEKPQGSEKAPLATKISQALAPTGSKQDQKTLKIEQQGLKLDQLQTKQGKTQATQLMKFKWGSPGVITHDMYSEAILDKMKELTYYFERQSKADGGGGGGGGRRPSFDWGGSGGMFGRRSPVAGAIEGVAHIAEGLMLSKIFDFKGILVDEFAYGRQMREIAYQTQAVAGSTETVQDTWTRLGKTVAETGLSRSEFQQAYVKNIKKGVREMGQTMKVTKAALNASKQLGMSASETSDQFYDWHMHLGYAASDIEAMNGSLKNVARQTGVTGENLQIAMKGASGLLKNLRDMGIQSTQAAESIMSLTAAGQKRGVGEEINKITNMLTGGWEQFRQGPQGLQGILLRAGDRKGLSTYGDVMGGGAMKSPEKLKALTQGTNEVVSEILGFDLLKKDLNELDDAQRMIFDNLMRKMTGMGLGQLQTSLKAMEEASETFTDKLGKLRKEMAKGGQTTEERMNLETKIAQLQINESTKVLSEFSKAAAKAKEEGKGISEAFSGVGLKKALMESQQSIATLLGVKPDQVQKMANEKPQELFEKTAIAKLKGLEKFSDLSNIKMKIDGGQITKLAKSGDPSKVQQAIETLEAENRRIATEAEARTDPIKAAQLDLLKVNEATRQLTGKILWGILGMMGELGVISALLTTQLAGGITKLGTNLFNMFGKEGRMKAGRAVGGAAQWIGGHLSADLPFLPSAAGQMGKELAELGAAFQLGIDDFGKAEGVIAGGMKGITTTLAGSFAETYPTIAALGENLGAFAKVAGTAGVIVGATAGAIYSITKAFEAGHRAAEIFNVEQEKLSLNQAWAAEGAGLLTGALNFLTFGIFRKSLGPTGVATQALAHFLAAVPPIGWAFQVILIPIKVLIGVLKGLWRFVSGVFTGIWEGLLAILSGFQPIIDAVSFVFNTLSEVFATLGGEGSGNISIIEALASALGFLGKTVGFVFQAVGLVIGTLIRVVLTPLKYAIEGIMMVVKPVLLIIKSLVDGIVAPFKWLYDILVGHSIIPDLVVAITGLFGTLAKGVLRLISGLPGMVGTVFSSIGSTIMGAVGGIGSGAAKLLGGVFPAFSKGFERAQAAGEGFFGSLARGLKGQIMSFTGGKGIIGAAKDTVVGGILGKAGPDGERTGGAVGAAKVGFTKAKGLVSGLFGEQARARANGVLKSMFKGRGLIGGLFGSSVAAAASSAATNAEPPAPAATPAAAGAKPPDASAAGKIGDALKNAAGPMLKFAAGAALVIAAILVLTKVMSMAGISQKEAMETALMVGVIIGGIVGIFAALSKLPPDTPKMIEQGAKVLDEIGQALRKSIKSILIGAAAFAVAAVAVVALAAGIVFISKAILSGMGVTPQVAAETAAAIASILLSAAEIAVLTAAACAVLAGIGWAWSYIIGAVPQMLLGALALYVAVPAILYLATALVKSAQDILFESGITPKVAAQTANAIAGILLATAEIAVLTAAACAVLAGVGWAWPVIMSALPYMLLGALALYVAIPAVMYLATALVQSAQKVLSESGLSADEALNVAEAVAGILLATAEIATLCAAACAVLAGVGWAWPVIMSALPYMLLGALALYVAIPAVMKLATALVQSAQQVMSESGMSPDEAMNVAEAVAGILLATAEIAGLTAIACGVLAGVGWAWPVIMNALPFMIMGAIVLAIAVPAIVKLATVLVQSANQIMQEAGMDANQAANVADAVASILYSAAKIAALSVAACAVLTGIGWAWPYILGSIPAMLVGAAILLLMVPAVVKLATAIVNFAKGIMSSSGLEPREAASVGEAVTSIIESAGSIASSVMAASAKLAILGAMSLGIAVMLFFMKAGSAALMAMSVGVLELASVIALIGKVLVNVLPQEAAEAISGTLTALGQVVDNLGKVMTNAANSMSDFLGLGFWGYFTTSPAKKLETAIPLFKDSFDGLAAFFKAVFETVTKNFEDAKAVEGVSQTLRALAGISEDLGSVMNSAVEKIVPLTEATGWFGQHASPIEKLGEAIPVFQTAFGNLAKFFSEGIIQPLENNFNGVGQVQTASQILEALASMMESVGKVLDVTSEKIITFVTSSWSWGKRVSPAKKLAGAIPDFKNSFAAIGTFLNEGIMQPVMDTFGEVERVNAANQILDGLAQMMDNVGKILEVTSEKVSNFVTSTGWWGKKVSPASKLIDNIPEFQTAFAAISAFLNKGVLLPVLGTFGEAAKVEAGSNILTSLSNMMESVGKLLETTSNQVLAFVTSSGGWGRKMSPAGKLLNAIPVFEIAFSSIASFLKNGVMAPILGTFGDDKKINEASGILSSLASMMESVAKILDSTSDKVVTFVTGSSIWGKRMSPASKLLDAVPDFEVAFDAIGKFLRDGVMKPVLATFGEGKDVGTATDILNNLSSMMESVGKIIDLCSDRILLFVTGTRSWGKKITPATKLMDAIPDFEVAFDAIGKFLRDGVMNPILGTFSDVKPVQDAANILSALGQMMEGVGQIISSASDKVIGFVAEQKTWGKKISAASQLNEAIVPFQNTFQNIASFFKEGIIEPLSWFQGIDFGFIHDVLGELPELLREVQLMLSSTAKELAAFAGNDEWFSLFGGIAWNLQKGASKIKDALGFTASFFRDGIIGPIMNLPGAADLDAAKGLLASTTKSLPSMMQSFGKISSMDFSQLSGGNVNPKITEDYTNKAQTVANNATTRAVASSAANPDLHYEMRKEQAGSDPQLTQVSGEELTEIADYAQNLEVLHDILEILKEMKDERQQASLSPVTGVSPTSSPFQRHSAKPLAPPNYHRMPAGNFNESPARQVANSGWH